MHFAAYSRLWRWGLAVAVSCCALPATAEPWPTAPAKTSDLRLRAPIDRWDEAIPLGNGLTGGLLWGGGRSLKLSLDRGDLWDNRQPDVWSRPDRNYATMRRLLAEKNQKSLEAMFRQPYLKYAYPTKIPAGRLEIDLGEGVQIKEFTLDLASAIGRARLENSSVEVFFHATEPVALIRLPGAETHCRLVPPASVQKLGYPPVEPGQEGNVQWFLQKTHDQRAYAVVVATRMTASSDAPMTELAVAIASTDDGPDPVSLGRQRAQSALDRGYSSLQRSHIDWWKKFWSRSAVAVPDRAIQQHYDLVQYFYGAASRRGAPPIPLQGVWTADAGKLPPWKGDFHNDLNTQMTYWACWTSGRFDQGASFTDFMWNHLPRHRKFAKNFFGVSGAAVPGVMSLAGEPIGGWCAYSLSPTMGAWIAHSFYQQWRYTKDERFLKERAYPYCEAIARCLEDLLEPDEQGNLKLPLSSSPEIHENAPTSWLTPNSNFDLSLLRWLFGAVAEMANARGDATAEAHWKDLLDRLDPLAVEGESGPLRISPDESLAFSHRHFSHLMAIYPLGTLHVEGSDHDRRIIDASIAQLQQHGTQRWTGYSFAWLACLAARTGKPELTLENLHVYLKAFTSRNGFHLNGDFKRLGYSRFTYRPFTLEGNFAAGQAVHEMLLQSWGGVVRVFPAVPKAWKDVEFTDLRAEGALAVSARRRGGKTILVRIRAEQADTLRLRDPFDGKPATWTGPVVGRKKDDYTCKLGKGQILVGRVAGEE
ncbi:MAG: glycoside hydrolase N-terminal domain-containing protein [Pirellulales bacterium]|nr:glycoside hydrolase N-terminal domain-containing protein [Pirellulales bacterium]